MWPPDRVAGAAAFGGPDSDGHSCPPKVQCTWLLSGYVAGTCDPLWPGAGPNDRPISLHCPTQYSEPAVSFVFHLATENKSPFLDTTKMDVNGADERNRLALKASRCARPLPVPNRFLFSHHSRSQSPPRLTLCQTITNTYHGTSHRFHTKEQARCAPTPRRLR